MSKTKAIMPLVYFYALKTLLAVWLGQFVCELFPNGDLWGIGHPDEAVGEAQIHRWEPPLCPPCKVEPPL